VRRNFGHDTKQSSEHSDSGAKTRNPHIYKVMRMDDNANTFQVFQTSSKKDAEAFVAKYTAHPHKQAFWIEEVPQSST
jgi:hypothetical protein